MLLRTRKHRFDWMEITAAGTIHQALTAGAGNRRLLHTKIGDYTFVIAHADDRAQALARADQFVAYSEPVFTVLLTDRHLAEVSAGNPRQLADVLDGHDNHRPVRTRINISGDDIDIQMTTEHGRFVFALATTDTLRKGQLFTCGKYSKAPGRRAAHPTLYRALTDYDPNTGAVERHVVVRNWDALWPVAVANLSNRELFGPHRLVYVATDHGAVLSRLGLADISETPTR